VLLLDTHCKDASPSLRRRPTLLDWMPIDVVSDLCQRCRAAGVRIALAGSLGLAELRSLRHTGPDWIAVRGAACADANRDGTIATARVAELVQILRR
jgi:uncharacterized protein (UPF0264 family)